MILYASKFGTVRDFVHLVPDTTAYDVSDRKSPVRRVLADAPNEPVFIVASIYAGKLNGAMRKFLEQERALFETRPVACGIGCLAEDQEAQDYLASAYPPWLIARAELSVVVGGRVRFATLPVFMRFFMKKILGSGEDVDRLQTDRAAEIHAWLTRAR